MRLISQDYVYKASRSCLLCYLCHPYIPHYNLINLLVQIRDEQEHVLRTIRGITRLDIANRFATVRRRYYSYPIGWIINGYGILYTTYSYISTVTRLYYVLPLTGALSISQGRGYFYQTGVDPIVSSWSYSLV